MSLLQRKITLDLSLANGSFEGGGNKATLSGFRVVCKISNVVAPGMGRLTAEVFGLPLSMMNQLTTLGTQTNLINQNKITVTAGDDNSGMALVFQGDIDGAFVNAQAQPDVSLHIEAHAVSFPAVQKTDPVSVKGSADVPQLMQQIAQKMGLTFEDAGVQVKLSNPYLWGNPWSQALSLAKAAGIGMVVENGTLAIWPKGKPRQGDAVIISPQTGMVGYPAFYSGGIIVRTLFDAAQSMKQQGKITVQSDLKPACGDWIVTNLEYDLESQVPRGQWFAIIQAGRGA